MANTLAYYDYVKSFIVQAPGAEEAAGFKPLTFGCLIWLFYHGAIQPNEKVVEVNLKC